MQRFAVFDEAKGISFFLWRAECSVDVCRESVDACSVENVEKVQTRVDGVYTP